MKIWKIFSVILLIGLLIACASESKPTGRIILSSPEGGEIFRRGDSIKIVWRASVAGNLNIYLATESDIGYNSTARTDFTLIRGNAPSTGMLSWPIPSSVQCGENCVIQITAMDKMGIEARAVSSRFAIQ